MPKYLNTTKSSISFTDVNGNNLTIDPGKEIITLGIIDKDGLKEVSHLPNVVPILKEDFVVGEAGEDIEIKILNIAKSIRVTNRSGNDIRVHYNNPLTQGMTIFNNLGVSTPLEDKDGPLGIEKIIIHLYEKNEATRGILVQQSRSLNFSS